MKIGIGLDHAGSRYNEQVVSLLAFRPDSALVNGEYFGWSRG
jgi:hypothetical protein